MKSAAVETKRTTKIQDATRSVDLRLAVVEAPSEEMVFLKPGSRAWAEAFKGLLNLAGCVVARNPDTGDRWEYIAGQSSGYGRQEVAAHLAQMAAQSGTTAYAVGLVSACHSMTLALPPGADVALDCPTIAWDGSRQHELEARVAELAAAQSPLYVLEEGLPYVSIETLPVDLIKLETFPRPGAQTAVNLYRVAPP